MYANYRSLYLRTKAINFEYALTLNIIVRNVYNFIAEN